MGKSLYDHFTEHYEKNLQEFSNVKGGFKKAFEKTNQDLGFDAYSCLESYSNCRLRKRRSGRK